MSESSQWLPPRAPDGREPPSFEARPEAPPVPPAPAQPPAQQQPVFVKPTREGSNTMATAALVLGIAGLTLLLFSAGTLFIFTIPISGAAVACAAAARRRLAEGAAQGGEGQVRAARIMGIVGIVLGVVAMIAWIALIASGVDLEQIQRDLERELERQRDQPGGEFSLLGRR